MSTTKTDVATPETPVKTPTEIANEKAIAEWVTKKDSLISGLDLPNQSVNMTFHIEMGIIEARIASFMKYPKSNKQLIEVEYGRLEDVRQGWTNHKAHVQTNINKNKNANADIRVGSA